MKICILTPRFPFPENGGDVLRINNIARYLKNKGNELILVSFYEHKITFTNEIKTLYDQIYVVKRNRITSVWYSFMFLLCGKPIQCGYYHSPKYSRVFKKVVKESSPDLYISHLLRMSPYIETIKATDRTIVEMTDALSKTYMLSAKAKGSILKKTIYAVERKRIKKYEQYVINVFSKVVLVSSEDIDLLKNINTRNLYLHTNGVDVCENISSAYDCNKICFIGNMRTLQNQDAVRTFIKEIFPLILKENQDAKFYIIGAEPPQWLKSLASKSIIVTGFVEDISSAIADACIAVAPIRIAAGIQNKVLVAMGNGIPVVMTSVISKAIPELHDGQNCIIRDSPQEIAKECIFLMKNKNQRNSIARNGYNMVKESYSWKSKLDGYEIIST